MYQKLSTLYEARSPGLARLFSIRDAGAYAEVVTPFLDPFNERISLYVREEGERYLVCDRGLGSRIVASAARADGQAILDQVRRDFGLSQSENFCYLVASEEDLLSRQFRMCTALVALWDRLCTIPRV